MFGQLGRAESFWDRIVVSKFNDPRFIVLFNGNPGPHERFASNLKGNFSYDLLCMM